MIGLLEITSIYQRLLVIRRFNTTPMNISENVASHMYFVALLCIALGEGKEVDMERVLGMALSHDLEESYSGDIITNIKRFHPGIEKALSETSREFLDIIFENVEIGKSMTALWEEYKEGKTEEAKLVKLADCISRVIIMSIELRMGNGYAKKIARNALMSVEESTDDPAIISECRGMLESVGLDCNSEHSYERFEK